jgi:hypothetical protein
MKNPFKGAGRVLKGVAVGAARNPRTTIAGLASLASLIFPGSAAIISAASGVAVGILSKDAHGEEAEAKKDSKCSD